LGGLDSGQKVLRFVSVLAVTGRQAEFCESPHEKKHMGVDDHEHLRLARGVWRASDRRVAGWRRVLLAVLPRANLDHGTGVIMEPDSPLSVSPASKVDREREKRRPARRRESRAADAHR
jgi:hypothetical protein